MKPRNNQMSSASISSTNNKEQLHYHYPAQSKFISHLYGLDEDGVSDSLSGSSSSRSTCSSSACQYRQFKSYRTPSSVISDRFTSLARRIVLTFVKPISMMIQILLSCFMLIVDGLKRMKHHYPRRKVLRRGGREHLLLIPLVTGLSLMIWLLTAEDIWNSVLTNQEQVDKKSLDTFKAEVDIVLEQFETYKKHVLSVADVEAIAHRLITQERLGDSLNLTNDNQKQLIQVETMVTKMEEKYSTLQKTVEDLLNIVARQGVMIHGQKDDILLATNRSTIQLEDRLATIQVKVHNVQRQNMQLENTVHSFSHRQDMKESILSLLDQVRRGQMIGDPVQDACTRWFHSGHVSKQELDSQLQELTANLSSRVMALLQELPASQIQQPLQEQTIKQMINKALLTYDADKLALHDFALETAGGSIVKTRCSRTYDKPGWLYTVFGFPILYMSNSPRTVIQPDVHPGQCWPFKGSVGSVTVSTSYRIIPSGFSIEHMPRVLSPTGKISSAPREFTVYGFYDENDNAGEALGNFLYDDNGSPLQYFPAQMSGASQVFKTFELSIHSNHGNPEYTCVYRFRIHGKVYSNNK